MRLLREKFRNCPFDWLFIEGRGTSDNISLTSREAVVLTSFLWFFDVSIDNYVQ